MLILLVVVAFTQPARMIDKDVDIRINDFDYPGMGMGMGRMNGNRGFHRGEGFGRGGVAFGPAMIEYLELNDDQIEKIYKIRLKYDKKEIDVRSEQKKLRIDKNEAMKDMDFAKARNVTKKMSEVTSKIQLMKIDQREEMSKILNKEQIKQMKKMHLMRNKGGKKGKMGKGFKR